MQFAHLLPTLAQDEPSSEGGFTAWLRGLRTEELVFLIPIIAIIVGGAVAITWMIFVHRERIAMIQQGMHPDAPKDKATEQPESDD